MIITQIKQNLQIFTFCWFAILSSHWTWASDVTQVPITVDQAVNKALTANPVILQSKANESAAGYGVKSAERDLLPKVSATYRYTGLGEEPIMKTPTGEMQAAHTNQFYWEVSVVQPLFTGFARELGLDNARLQEEYAKEQTQISKINLILDVKNACYQMLLSQKALAVTEDEMRALKAHSKDAQVFYEQGLVPRNELLKSKVALAAAVQRVEKAKAGVEIASTELNTLLNRDQDSVVILAEANVPAESSPLLEDLYEKALSNRPVLALLSNTVKQLDNAEGLAKSPRYPHVNLVGAYSQDGDSLEASTNDFSNAYNTTIMLEVKWTFFQWGKSCKDVSRVQKEKQAILYQIRNMENQIRLQVKSSTIDLNVSHNNITTAETALIQARENYRITDLQYRQQVVDSSEVLDARVYLTDAERNYYVAIYDYLRALARLDRAVGQKIES